MSKRKVSGALKLLLAVLKSMWAIILAATLGAVAAFGITAGVAEPKYEAGALLYIEQTETEAGLHEDLYKVILYSETTLDQIKEVSQTEYSYDELRAMLGVSSVNGTDVYRVGAVNIDPEAAEVVAKSATEVLPERIKEIADGVTVKTVDAVSISEKRDFGFYYINAAVGAAVLAVFALLVIILRTVKDAYIRKKEHLEYAFDLPVLSIIPRSKKPVLCDKLSGVRGEAYKRLRANIGFCYLGFEGSKVIGVTSASRKECKTITAINVAYTMAQSGKRVLLIDGDMRYPSISTKLDVVSKTGLPDLLAGTGKKEDAIKRTMFAGSGVEFDVISTGAISAISSELLGSQRMKMLLADLKERYNCIVVDLPSACRFSDAAVFSQYADGILLTVRANHSKSAMVEKAVSQFEFAKANILGFVYY